MTLDAEEVLAEATAWIYVPDGAATVDTDDFLVVAYPEHFSEKTVAARIDSARAADAVIDDARAAALSLGRDTVTFFDLSDATRPADLEARLQERGGLLVETLAVLALDLTDGVPDLDLPEDVVVSPVTTLDDLRDVDVIDTTVFGGTRQDDAALARTLAEGSGARAVARRGGRALGSAGWVVGGTTMRLWGGAVLPEAQHTGLYRALLDHRLRAGVEAGCRMALVKGRVQTSAPVLRRAGFRQYGEVRAHRLATGP